MSKKIFKPLTPADKNLNLETTAVTPMSDEENEALLEVGKDCVEFNRLCTLYEAEGEKHAREFILT